jgi:hypothetical protein
MLRFTLIQNKWKLSKFYVTVMGVINQAFSRSLVQKQEFLYSLQDFRTIRVGLRQRIKMKADSLIAEKECI